MRISKIAAATLFIGLSTAIFANNDVLTGNGKKAADILNGFENRDTKAIAKWTNKDGFVHHIKNKDGKIKVIRTITDGNYVVLQSDYGEKIGYDVFRFERGKAVEHWDNFESKKQLNPSGHSMIDGATEVKDKDKTNANKAFVLYRPYSG